MILVSLVLFSLVNGPDTTCSLPDQCETWNSQRPSRMIEDTAMLRDLVVRPGGLEHFMNVLESAFRPALSIYRCFLVSNCRTVMCLHMRL